MATKPKQDTLAVAFKRYVDERMGEYREHLNTVTDYINRQAPLEGRVTRLETALMLRKGDITDKANDPMHDEIKTYQTRIKELVQERNDYASRNRGLEADINGMVTQCDKLREDSERYRKMLMEVITAHPFIAATILNRKE